MAELTQSFWPMRLGGGYTVSGTVAALTISGTQGNDTLNDIEYVRFTNSNTTVAIADLLTQSTGATASISPSFGVVSHNEGNSGTTAYTFTIYVTEYGFQCSDR